MVRAGAWGSSEPSLNPGPTADWLRALGQVPSLAPASCSSSVKDGSGTCGKNPLHGSQDRDHIWVSAPAAPPSGVIAPGLR